MCEFASRPISQTTGGAGASPDDVGASLAISTVLEAWLARATEEATLGSMPGVRAVKYAPQGLGRYGRDFHQCLAGLKGLTAKKAVAHLTATAAKVDVRQDPMAAGFRLSLLLLRDYILSGYVADIRGGDVWLVNAADIVSPLGGTPTRGSVLRGQFEEARNRALAAGESPATIASISRVLEREAASESSVVLEALQAGPPLLQVRFVPSGSGALRDLYRAVRATWTMPPDKSAPGREVSVVVDDLRYPGTPLGVLQLRNVVPEIRARDLWLGLVSDPMNRHTGFIGALRGDDAQERLGAVRTTMLALLTNVRDEGLPKGASTWQGVSDSATKALDDALAAAKHGGLTARQEGDKAAQLEFMAIQKRCETTIELRRGLAAVDVLLSCDSPQARISEDEDIRRSLEAGTRKIWHYHMGFAVVELAVCGAAPPFGPLRLGKLMASLSLTKEVLSGWGTDRPLGDIARMVYRDEVRVEVRNPGPLVVFTSGLYPGHSAQYNRARAGHLTWKRVGSTQGYGASHIGADTTSAVDDFNRLKDGYDHVSRTFGEGSGARFRAVGRSLGALGLPDLRKHDVQRPLYAAPLVSDPLGVLLGWSDERPELPDAQAVANQWWSRHVGDRATEFVETARSAPDLPETIAALLRETGHSLPPSQGLLQVN